MAQIDRRITALAGRIDIDHFDVLPDGTRLEVLFPAYIEDRLVDAKRLQTCAERRVVGIHAKRPVRRLANLRVFRVLELQPLNRIPGHRQGHRHADLISAQQCTDRFSQRL